MVPNTFSVLGPLAYTTVSLPQPKILGRMQWWTG